MMLGGNDTRHIPLGDSGAAAIVVSVPVSSASPAALTSAKVGAVPCLLLLTRMTCRSQVLYLAGAAAIIANWQKTGFHYYKALITSTAREFPHTPPLQPGHSVCH